MAEIRQIPSNGLKVVSTFSGAGGSCLGYRMAGYRVLWANEFIPAAQEVYRLNHPDSYLDTRDIREVQPEGILTRCGLAKGDLDLLDGSPPCASFSSSGKGSALWGQVKDYSETRQRTDDLFFEYIRLLKGLQPRAFVAENVSGLVRGPAKGMFLEFLAAMKASGYRVQCRVLDAQFLGVPQRRKRAIFVGVREDLCREPLYPKPLPYCYSLREAIDSENAARWPVEDDACKVSDLKTAEWRRLAPGASSDKYLNLARAHAELPCPTVISPGKFGAAVAVVMHPSLPRRFSIPELKRIFSFPDDFALTGTYFQQWERLARSVPPVMMQAIARALYPVLVRRDH